MFQETAGSGSFPSLKTFVSLFRHAAAAVALVLLVSANGFAQLIPGPECNLGFVGDLRKAIANPQDADEFFLMIHAFNPEALRGTADTLKYVGGDRFHNMLDVLDSLRDSGRMPFSTDEELFETIAGLSARADTPANGISGLTSIVGNLAGNDINAQGAAFSLFVAKKIANNGADYSKVRAFEVSYSAGERSRRYDIVDSSGRHHENKSWTQGLPSAGSTDSLDFMSEFRADVIIDGANGFNLTQYNLHSSVNSGLAELRARLIDQFDHPEIISALGEDLLEARTAFERAWDTGVLYSLHAF